MARSRVHSAVIRKNKLLEMAKRGDPRPKQRKHSLGSSLSRYTCKKSKGYDEAFSKEIMRIAPEWFEIRKGVEEKQAELLKLAREGHPKPHRTKHYLGAALNNYTSRTSASYDFLFDMKMRRIAPNWFSRSQRSRENDHARKESQTSRNGA